MKITIAGGHGQIALLLSDLLSKAGHSPIALIRNPAHADEVRAAGAEPVLLDLESSSLADVASALDGSDAVVFAAGAGPGSGAERKLTVDRDGAILLANAAAAAGVRRVVVISAIGADTFDATSAEEFQVYLRAKSEADASVRALDLDWTIVRPGTLVDTPGTGLIAAGTEVSRGSISRADVATVIAASITGSAALRTQFEVVAGTTPVGEALAAL
ncbi:MAG: NAD(P)H-binding protein [Burkholderiaceae bacterium]|nr:NAD(P)H-binding protein [Microbacteriaceae bacterium]